MTIKQRRPERSEGGGPGVAEATGELERLRAEVAAWRAKYAKGELREIAFTNSAREVEPLYTALDVPPESSEALGVPGQYPFTRGIHPTGYRGKLWTMRQFAGFGSPRETNERYKFLLEHGTSGLSVAFDFPTLMGYDSDHPRSEGEVGKCGVAISSLKDMEDLFEGIPLDKVSTSMTINGPAIILWAFYIAAAEKQGVSSDQLQGTIQNDILKEYMAQHAWCFPIEPALRLIVDCFEWGAKHAPKWNTISISGYHIREAGSTAAQELAFTLADGFTYVERGVARGMNVDDFAGRLSYFWDIHNDFFEEIAKLRAARRIWARHLKERYGAKNPRSWVMRFHSQTAGVTLTAQQPMNNIVRVAYQAMAAVLGGTQSLHTNSMDETLALPTEQSVQVALRTQQVLAYERRAERDRSARRLVLRRSADRPARARGRGAVRADRRHGRRGEGARGGLVPEEDRRVRGARQQWEIEQHRRVIVGVNEFVTDEEALTIPTLKIGAEVDADQKKRLAALRKSRDQKGCDQALAALRTACKDGTNTMPFILDCARKYCTLYEIRRAMEDVFGAYREPVFF